MRCCPLRASARGLPVAGSIHIQDIYTHTHTHTHTHTNTRTHRQGSMRFASTTHGHVLMRRKQGEEEEATALQIQELEEDSEMRMREHARPREHLCSGGRAGTCCRHCRRPNNSRLLSLDPSLHSISLLSFSSPLPSLSLSCAPLFCRSSLRDAFNACTATELSKRKETEGDKTTTKQTVTACVRRVGVGSCGRASLFRRVLQSSVV